MITYRIKYNLSLSSYRPIQTDIKEYVLSHTEVHSSKNSESPHTNKRKILKSTLLHLDLIKVLENLIPQENVESGKEHMNL